MILCNLHIVNKPENGRSNLSVNCTWSYNSLKEYKGYTVRKKKIA